MKKSSIMLMLMALMMSVTSFAQGLKGHVIDENGEPVIGATVAEKSNPKNAQLVFTTHNTNLLDLDILRRDQIWFTEKDEQTSVSELFSLDDYSIRKDSKIEKKYLLGRFGAIPVFRGGLL